MKFKNILLSLLVLLTLSFSFPVSAQNILSPNQATQTVQDTTVVPIQPIPTTDITNASSVALTLVVESGKSLLKEEEIKNYTDKVDTLLSVVNVFYSDILVDSLELSSPRELNNYQMKAQIYVGRIDNLHQDLSQRSKNSEGVVEQLNNVGKQWQLTLEKAPELLRSES